MAAEQRQTVLIDGQELEIPTGIGSWPGRATKGDFISLLCLGTPYPSPTLGSPTVTRYPLGNYRLLILQTAQPTHRPLSRQPPWSSRVERLSITFSPRIGRL